MSSAPASGCCTGTLSAFFASRGALLARVHVAVFQELTFFSAELVAIQSVHSPYHRNRSFPLQTSADEDS